jgi:protein-S-isoprenylcysteine O-methyltransferase Ste14
VPNEDAVTLSTMPASRRPTMIPWPPILVAVLVVAGWQLQRLIPLPWTGIDDTAARIVGVGLGVAGLALAGWAALTMWRNGTTILPNRAASALVTTGPFRRWRNPIYIADVLIMLCAAELTKSMWIVLLAPVFVILVTWLAILPEERHLEARFGDAFRDYLARSRRWL